MCLSLITAALKRYKDKNLETTTEKGIDIIAVFIISFYV